MKTSLTARSDRRFTPGFVVQLREGPDRRWEIGGARQQQDIDRRESGGHGAGDAILAARAAK
ncbi:MAG: hypothetical protein WDN69_17560 [Aliidongia sp.]